MKYYIPFLVLMAYVANVKSQSLNLKVKDYTWTSVPSVYKPDSNDLKYSMVMVSVKKAIEYEIDEKRNLHEYYLRHTVKLMNDDKAIEDNNKLYVSVSSYSETLLSVKTRVIDQNGKITFESSEKDFIQVEEDNKKYNMLAIKGLVKGCMLETILVFEVEGDLYGDEFLQMDYPIAEADFTLITPERLRFNSKLYNGSGTITDTIYDHRRISFIKASHIPAIDEEEKYSLTNANKMRVEYVFAQNMENMKKNSKWPEMGRVFFERMNAGYDKNESAIEKMLSEINLKKYKTLEEKVFAIENYIKTTIALEPNAKDPETVANILKVKYCSGFRMNQLFAQTYRKAGINCELVLTCQKSYKRFDPNFDSWAYLKNVILYFPELDKFIDPQEAFLRLGKIDTDYLDQDGVFIKTITIGDLVTASASIKKIPANDPVKSKDLEKYTITFKPDMENVNVTYHREMNGYGEMGLKSLYYLGEDDKKNEFMESFVKGFAKESTVSNLKVENYNITSLQEVNSPLLINAQISTSHYIETAGSGKVLFKIGELIGEQTEMYQDKPRTTPIDISFVHSYDRTIIINLPDGYKAKGLDKLLINHTYNNGSGKPSFGFVSSYKMENNQLIVSCTEYYYDLTNPVSIFNEYKKVINDAADFNKISILIEKD